MSSVENSDNFNADELVAPEWLNTQFFTEVLSNHEKAPELKVLKIQISPASAKGDHYASVMFRANVTYTTQKGEFSKSLIIKTMPEIEGHKKEMIGNSHIFKTEIDMYSKALPKFEEILHAAGDETKLCAECFYYSLEPRQLMIFEDLLPQGYIVVRDREATTEELHAAFTKLAKIHAVSFHLLNDVGSKYRYNFKAQFKLVFYLFRNLLTWENSSMDYLKSPIYRMTPFFLVECVCSLSFWTQFPSYRSTKHFLRALKTII